MNAHHRVVSGHGGDSGGSARHRARLTRIIVKPVPGVLERSWGNELMACSQIIEPEFTPFHAEPIERKHLVKINATDRIPSFTQVPGNHIYCRRVGILARFD